MSDVVIIKEAEQEADSNIQISNSEEERLHDTINKIEYNLSPSEDDEDEYDVAYEYQGDNDKFTILLDELGSATDYEVKKYIYEHRIQNDEVIAAVAISQFSNGNFTSQDILEHGLTFERFGEYTFSTNRYSYTAFVDPNMTENLALAKARDELKVNLETFNKDFVRRHLEFDEDDVSDYVTYLDDDIEQAQEAVNSVEQDIETCQKAIAGYQAQIVELQASLQDQTDEIEIQSINDEIESLNDDIESEQDDIESYEYDKQAAEAKVGEAEEYKSQRIREIIDDPFSYFEGELGYDFDAIINIGTFNYDDAADSAVGEDGEGYWLFGGRDYDETNIFGISVMVGGG